MTGFLCFKADEMRSHTHQTKGTVAEQAVTLAALQRNRGVAAPVRNFLPHDIIFDVNNKLLKIQVKRAWYDATKQNYVIDNRRTKNNRREMLKGPYDDEDFDFAILYIDTLSVFYVMPSAVFNSYGSEIHLVEEEKRQRKPKSYEFREAWELLGGR